jgi:hypothetical protein
MTALRHFCAPKAGELRINAGKPAKPVGKFVRKFFRR